MSKFVKFTVNIFFKVVLILFVVFIYAIVIDSFAINKNDAKIYKSDSKPMGVCVFDIDFTLNCDGAIAAVNMCKDYGFALAINTARNKSKAYEILNNNYLLTKGFSQEFINIAKQQEYLNGPFQYKENASFGQPEEQILQNKSYGMRQIATYYNLKLDNIESLRLILFDDMLHNIVQIEPTHLDPYNKSMCKKNIQEECYSDPNDSPKEVSYPRNWKIYSSKWVGYKCLRWNDPAKAATDAYDMINKILSNY